MAILLGFADRSRFGYFVNIGHHYKVIIFCFMQSICHLISLPKLRCFLICICRIDYVHFYRWCLDDIVDNLVLKPRKQILVDLVI